jgi:hypothetical protein
MAENVVIKEMNGVFPGTGTALTSIVGRYCTSDTYNPGTNYPCKVPTADFYYSYWKTMYMDVSGTFNSIRDIYWYCDGNVATDWGLDSANGGCLTIGKMNTGDNGILLSAYKQALGSEGVSGYAIGDPTNGHLSYRGQTYPAVDVDSYTASTPLLIDSSIYTAAFQSKAWVSQLKIPPTAAHGELTSKTFNLMYQVY